MKEPPSIIAQARRQGFESQFYNFRSAKTPEVEYYNSALLRRDDGLWLVARRSVMNPALTYGENSLMAFKLDDNHLPQYGIPIEVPYSRGEHFEDPRVTIHDGRYFLSACNFIIHPDRTWTGAHQVLIEVSKEWRVLRKFDPIYGKNGRGVRHNTGDEKNWLWFWHGGELHMIYQTRPHIVTRWDNSVGIVEQWETPYGHPNWQHGHPRGGSAPVRVGDEYFCFFHSSMPWREAKRRYFMGCYAFEAKPPFRITRMTTEPLLAGSLRDPWAEGKPLVVFPCSAILDEPSPPPREYIAGRVLDAIWTVSLGVNDLVSAYVRIPHARLIKKLHWDIEPLQPPEREVNKLEALFR